MEQTTLLNKISIMKFTSSKIEGFIKIELIYKYFSIIFKILSEQLYWRTAQTV